VNEGQPGSEGGKKIAKRGVGGELKSLGPLGVGGCGRRNQEGKGIRDKTLSPSLKKAKEKGGGRKGQRLRLCKKTWRWVRRRRQDSKNNKRNGIEGR